MSNEGEIERYFKSLGFESVCYESGDQQCRSDLNGMYVNFSEATRTVKLSVIDGMVECHVSNISYPNDNIPGFINQLKRHVF